MNCLNIFKIKYSLYEGEYGETLLGKNVEQEEFEKDIIKAKEFAEGLIGIEINDGDYLGKGYSVQCLPEYYEQIIWYLTEKLGYIECYYGQDIRYDVDDAPDKKINITQIKKKTERNELKSSIQN